MTRNTASVTTERDRQRDTLARAGYPSGVGVTLSRVTEQRDVTVGERDSTASRPTRHEVGEENQAVTIFALDPGPTETGWCIFDGATVIDSGVHANADLLPWVKHGQGCDYLAIEMIANMGMAVGVTTFQTVRWIGRFQQAWKEPEDVHLVMRHQVKSCICHNQRAKDANIRQALVDLLGAPGTKKKPGPTYGVTSHAWSALAVAVTALEKLGIKVDPKQMPLGAAPVACARLEAA